MLDKEMRIWGHLWNDNSALKIGTIFFSETSAKLFTVTWH